MTHTHAGRRSARGARVSCGATQRSDAAKVETFDAHAVQQCTQGCAAGARRGTPKAPPSSPKMRNAFAAVRDKAAAAAAEAAAASREALKEARAAAKETMAETKTAASALRRDMDKAKDALVTKVKEAQQHNRRSESSNAEALAGAFAFAFAVALRRFRPLSSAHAPPAAAEGGEGSAAAAERFGAGVSPTGARLFAARPHTTSLCSSPPLHRSASPRTPAPHYRAHCAAAATCHAARARCAQRLRRTLRRLRLPFGPGAELTHASRSGGCVAAPARRRGASARVPQRAGGGLY